MKRLLGFGLLIGGLVLSTATASAQTSCTTQAYGNNAYTSCSDGTSATTQSYGGNSATTFSDGTTAITKSYGGTSSTTIGAQGYGLGPATTPADGSSD